MTARVLDLGELRRKCEVEKGVVFLLRHLVAALFTFHILDIAKGKRVRNFSSQYPSTEYHMQSLQQVLLRKCTGGSGSSLIW